VTFAELWAELAPIGRDPETRGYRRAGLSPAERDADTWFVEAARTRDLTVETDSIGNHVAWWRPAPSVTGPGVITGSHLDSVPDGGAFDGPLGVVSALAAVDLLRSRGFVPDKPVGISVFVEEEGSRFGMPCLGSRLATGALDPARALALRDRRGVTLAEAYDRAGVGVDPDEYGRSDLVDAAAVFVELHVEQGRWLAEADAGAGASVGVATAIWPHGRWRLEFSGRADHAGTTRMEDRADPMLTAAFTVLSANKRARLGEARATVGRLEIDPGATNAVPERVRAWLDVRGVDQGTVDAVVEEVCAQARDRASRDGTAFSATVESMSPLVAFDPDLALRLAEVVGALRVGGGPAPMLPTAAGHDAGILAAAGVPTAMLFVRNPTGISHSPAEHAEAADCEAGVEALAAVLADLAGEAGSGSRPSDGDERPASAQ
jgi:beta-ureidopropionase / N-carbamoyl-L-amino-acid hydrolase